MNANQLWAGSDYAWSDYLRRGERYTERNVRRVRVIKVTQKVLWGNEKASTYVEVWDIDEETEEPVDQERTRSVRARDIFMHWDEYADERERREVERAKKQREEAERQRTQKEADEKTTAGLIELGIPEGAIRSVYDWQIVLDRRLVDQALGINQLRSVS